MNRSKPPLSPVCVAPLPVTLDAVASTVHAVRPWACMTQPAATTFVPVVLVPNEIRSLGTELNAVLVVTEMRQITELYGMAPTFTVHVFEAIVQDESWKPNRM